MTVVTFHEEQRIVGQPKVKFILNM